jgi:amidase
MVCFAKEDKVTTKVDRNQLFFAFGPDLQPATQVRRGEEVMEHLKGLPTPFAETDKVVATIYSAQTIDEAANGAIHRMAQFLTDFVKIPLNDAGMLMSLVGELKFCQVVDPLKAVRFEFPKYILEVYGYNI